MKRIPAIASIAVGLAVALMIGLGVWQLQRSDEKAGLLVQYARAGAQPEMAFPIGQNDDALLFRRARAMCLESNGHRVEAGRNKMQQSGWRHIVRCRTGVEGPGFLADIGWSKAFDAMPKWKGGNVAGIITRAPDHRSLIGKAFGTTTPPEPMLVADEAIPPLQASAPPSLDEIPNNHFSYAVQWFIFAALGLTIYAIALRQRR